MTIKTVAIICGGPSAEHEVSLRSALNIAQALDSTLFSLIIIAINKQGQWFEIPTIEQLADCARNTTIADHFDQVALLALGKHSALLNLTSNKQCKIDVLFPILHGPFGEDGAIQGLAKFCHLPCVGPGILGSSIGMDKDVFKTILRQNDIQVSPSITLHKHLLEQFKLSDVGHLGLPLYVKPCNMGSSVGVSKVNKIDDLQNAIDIAFQYDQKILIEQQITGRELEIAVLGNHDIQTSSIGEVLTQSDFYSYASKYEGQENQTQIPAILTDELQKNISSIAKKTYQACQLSGLARVDVFLTADNQVIVNEVNTLPGFTNISMYPQLWNHAGLTSSDLMTRLIDLAIEQFNNTQVSMDCTSEQIDPALA
ncbi:MAG: D-alanine--D-alanine ligase [Saccharospirillaceae bacterium]|nr:D-alanine--D-alanine ligase [Saccharospirillaceae bacterium]